MPLQQRWITKLLGFDYEIHYKRGLENKTADALSRRGDSTVACAAVTTLIPTWVQQVVQSYVGDSFVQSVFNSKEQDPASFPDYSILQGLLRYKGRIYVGDALNFREMLISEMHTSPYGGHSVILGTYLRLKRDFGQN